MASSQRGVAVSVKPAATQKPVTIKPADLLSPRPDPSSLQSLQPDVPKLTFLESHARRVRSASGVRKPARLTIGERAAQAYSSKTANPLSARLPEITPSEFKPVSQWPTEVTGKTLNLDLSNMSRGKDAAALSKRGGDIADKEPPFPAWYTPRAKDLSSGQNKGSNLRKPVLGGNVVPQRVPVPPQVHTPKREDPGLRCTHESEMDREQPSFVNRKQLSDAKMLAHANRRAGKIRYEGIAYYKMGVLHDNLKEYKKAIQQYKKFLSICLRTHDTVGEALAYNCIAVDYQLLGGPANLAKSVEYHTKHRDVADVGGKFTSYSNLGLVYQQTGDLDQAVHNHQNALRHAIHMSSLEGESLACANLGVTGAAHGELATARACAERHLQLAASMHDGQAETEAHKCLGDLAITNGEYEVASQEFEHALEISSADTRGVNQAKSARCAIGPAKGNAKMEQHMKEIASQLTAR